MLNIPSLFGFSGKLNMPKNKGKTGKQVLDILSIETDLYNAIRVDLSKIRDRLTRVSSSYDTSILLSDIEAIRFSVMSHISNEAYRKELLDEVDMLEYNIEQKISNAEGSGPNFQAFMDLVALYGDQQQKLTRMELDQTSVLIKSLQGKDTYSPMDEYAISKRLYGLSIKFSSMMAQLDQYLLRSNFSLEANLTSYNAQMDKNPGKNSLQGLSGVIAKAGHDRVELLKSQPTEVVEIYTALEVLINAFDRLDQMVNSKKIEPNVLESIISLVKNNKVAFSILGAIFAVGGAALSSGDASASENDAGLQYGDTSISNADFSAYSLNFASNPRASFDFGDKNVFSSDELSKMKKVPGFKVIKNKDKKTGEVTEKVTYTPYLTLNSLKGQKSISTENISSIFKGNKILLQHFQFFLDSKLGVKTNNYSGEFDSATMTKLSSVMKNESIFDMLERVLKTYGSKGLNVTILNGKIFVTYTDIQNFDDKESIAVLDLPFFDENGEVQFINDYNSGISLAEMPLLKETMFVPGLDANVLRSMLDKWIESVNEQIENIKHQDLTQEELRLSGSEQLKREPSLLNAKGPSILSGKGKLLSGTMSSNSGMGIILKQNALGLSHEDDIKMDRVNIKASLEYIAEATSMGNNSRVAAKLIMLYSMARVGTSIYLEKGDLTTKAGAGVSYKTDSGDVIKLDYGFFKQFLEYTFAEANVKRKLAPDQHGLSASYTKKQYDQFEVLKEIVFSARAFKVNSMNLGEIGKLTSDINNVFEQYKYLGALQGGTKAEAEVNFALDLAQTALGKEIGLTNFRLDVAPSVGVEKRDKVLNAESTTKLVGGLRTKFTTLLFDDSVKASLSFDVRSGNIYSVGVDLSTKISIGEVGLYAKQDVYGPNIKPIISAGFKGVSDLTTTDNDVDAPKYSPLFSINSNFVNFLTYTEADIDPKLFSGYAVVPKAIVQKIREYSLDMSKLPPGSKIEKNPDGTLKQLDLATGVNNLDGTILVNPTNLSGHFSVTGNSFISVKDLDKIPVPGLYPVTAGQTTGDYVLFNFKPNKGSFMVDEVQQILANAPKDVAMKFLKGEIDFDGVKKEATGLPNVPGTISSGNVVSKTAVSIEYKIGATTGMTNVRAVLVDGNIEIESKDGIFPNLMPNTKYTIFTVGDDYNEQRGITEVKRSNQLVVETNPASIEAPKFVSKTTNSLKFVSGEYSGLKNLTYILYSDSSLTTKVSENTTGEFTGLAENTAYYAVVKGEILKKSGPVEYKTSVSLQATTDKTIVVVPPTPVVPAPSAPTGTINVGSYYIGNSGVNNVSFNIGLVDGAKLYINGVDTGMTGSAGNLTYSDGVNFATGVGGGINLTSLGITLGDGEKVFNFTNVKDGKTSSALTLKVFVETAAPTLTEPTDGWPTGNKTGVVVNIGSASGVDFSTLQITSQYGGTVSGIVDLGNGNIQFNYALGAQAGDELVFTGKTKAGNDINLSSGVFYY